jgi:hypothetical protein
VSGPRGKVHPNAISTEPPAIANRFGSLRWRSVGYWLATVLVVAELGLGGIWDIVRIPTSATW